MDWAALAREELRSALYIFEHWTDGNRALRDLLAVPEGDEAALNAARRRLQRTGDLLSPHVTVKAKHVYAPYCIALAGDEFAQGSIHEYRYLRICALVHYAEHLHKRAIDDLQGR